VTIREVLELSLGLMDEIEDEEAYEARAVPIMNVLQGEMARAAGIRGYRADSEDLDDYIGLPEELMEGVAPYGLAAHLLLEENPALASYFSARYEELLMRYARGLEAEINNVTNLYGGIEYGEFGRW